jgi:hypothetical protein
MAVKFQLEVQANRVKRYTTHVPFGVSFAANAVRAADIADVGLAAADHKESQLSGIAIYQPKMRETQKSWYACYCRAASARSG